MALQEDPQATWDKRFKARHYAYRDFHIAITGPAPATYVFGTNARAISRWNWPALDDFTTILESARLPCYAREVKVLCTEDCWVVFISLNPIAIRLAEIDYTAAQIAALGVPATITEIAQFIPADDEITFYPTYGTAIVFYQATLSGTIYIYAEGNTEGGE
jgi:hypothetical protein